MADKDSTDYLADKPGPGESPGSSELGAAVLVHTPLITVWTPCTSCTDSLPALWLLVRADMTSEALALECLLFLWRQMCHLTGLVIYYTVAVKTRYNSSCSTGSLECWMTPWYPALFSSLLFSGLHSKELSFFFFIIFIVVQLQLSAFWPPAALPPPQPNPPPSLVSCVLYSSS